MSSHKAVIECPFCKQMSVEAYHHPSFLQGTTTRISNKSKTTYHRVPESIEPMTDCSNCGKSKKEIIKAFNEPAKKETHEDKLKRFRDSGLPLILESKNKE